MKKGAIPIFAITMLVAVGIFFVLYFFLVNIKILLSQNTMFSFFETTSVKHTFYLTERSLQGGLQAITSEAVFHPLDVGIPDSCKPSCYVMINPPATTTTIFSTATSTTTTTTATGETTTSTTMETTTSTVNPLLYETSYRKYPKQWVAETSTYYGKFLGEAAWTQGTMRYPEMTYEQFSKYYNDYLYNFLFDHLATEFITPVSVKVAYNISYPQLLDNEVNFSAGASLTVGLESGLEKASTNLQQVGPFVFEYPISKQKVYDMLGIGKKIVKGFDPGEISFSDSTLSFNDFMRKLVLAGGTPSNEEEERSMEESLKEAISSKLDDYSSSISGAKGIDVKFTKNKDLFMASLRTQASPDYSKRYDAYLMNYNIYVSMSDPSGEAFCCNWNPLSNTSAKEKPGLKLMLNDTFLALDCDPRHKTAIWKDHRDDYLHLLCEGSGNYAWKDFQEFNRTMGDVDLVLDLDHENGPESFWDKSNETWYRCGYSLGDVKRVDIGYENKYKGDEEFVDMAIFPVEEKFSGASSDSGAGTGKLLCSIKDETRVSDNPGDSGSDLGNRWLRCFDNVQDFRILRMKAAALGEGGDEFEDKYCCINKILPDTEKYICNEEEQMSDQYCCECFGNTWVGSGGRYGAGYCIGDDWCEREQGESASNSEDCCQCNTMLSNVDPSDDNYLAMLNKGTQADVKIVDSSPYRTTDNRCYSACNAKCGITVTESYPTCSGSSIKQCDGNTIDCGTSYKTCATQCNTIEIEMGCGDSRIVGAPGEECFRYTKNPVSCNGYICSEGSCSTTQCSIGCGATCEIVNGNSIGCDDQCRTESADKLVTGRSCDTSSCSCISEQVHVCTSFQNEGNHVGDIVECDKDKYVCRGEESIGIFMWELFEYG